MCSDLFLALLCKRFGVRSPPAPVQRLPGQKPARSAPARSAHAQSLFSGPIQQHLRERACPPPSAPAWGAHRAGAQGGAGPQVPSALPGPPGGAGTLRRRPIRPQPLKDHRQKGKPGERRVRKGLESPNPHLSGRQRNCTWLPP